MRDPCGGGKGRARGNERADVREVGGSENEGTGGKRRERRLFM